MDMADYAQVMAINLRSQVVLCNLALPLVQGLVRHQVQLVLVSEPEPEPMQLLVLPVRLELERFPPQVVLRALPQVPRELCFPCSPWLLFCCAAHLIFS